MKQQTTPVIILRRTNYGEADRIISFLTPTGKISALVKGVRRSKSKLAGGIELFSESTIVFMRTKGELARIISTRLETYWENIVGDLPRMMFGYEAMKLLGQIIEDEAERSYYELLKSIICLLIITNLQTYLTVKLSQLVKIYRGTMFVWLGKGCYYNHIQVLY